jgi:CBS domain containing-hemolysin-like protein
MLMVLSILAFLFSTLRSAYQATSLKELHHRQKHGDTEAGLLLLVARYEVSSDVILLSLMIIFGASAVVLATYVFNWILALLFIVGLIWVVFIRNNPPSQLGTAIASKIAPYFAQLLLALQPLNDQGDHFFSGHPRITHTKVYDKTDLLELLDMQMHVSGSEVDSSEIDIAKHALTYGDKIVKDYMTPRRIVRFVDGNEPVGPILINELHESGFSRFPVWGDDENTIVGTLYMHDLVQQKRRGIVKNAMKSQVYYVNESSTLQGVLAAFLRTKHHLFIVVNEFEEIVGIITIEDILEQILGRKIVDEFDQYEDLRAVAKQQAAKKDAKEHKKPYEVTTSATEAKVVE